MFARTLITLTATAGIVAGALSFTATGAAAAGPGYGPQFGEYAFPGPDLGPKGPGHDWKPGKDFEKDWDKGPKADWHRPGIQPRPHGGFAFNFGQKPHCAPVYGQKWRWSPWAGWYLVTVKVDEKCTYPRFQPRWPW